MSASKSLALLICGGLSSNLLDQYGDYTVVFGKFLRSALPDVDFTLDPYDVREMEYPSEETIDSYDGVLLTGSGGHFSKLRLDACVNYSLGRVSCFGI